MSVIITEFDGHVSDDKDNVNITGEFNIHVSKYSISPTCVTIIIIESVMVVHVRVDYCTN